MNKLLQDSAFPFIDGNAVIGNAPFGDVGMSKRFYAACAAMHGLLSNSAIIEALSSESETANIKIIEASYELADLLLEKEL